MIFHHTRWAKPMVNSQPMNQITPAAGLAAPALPFVKGGRYFVSLY
jgi:hypothetical protein